MNPFPEDWLLIAFFESEPVVTDPHVPWIYNSLKFRSARGNDVIECRIDPGFGYLKFNWSRDSVDLVALDLHMVEGIQVEVENGRDVMTAFIGGVFEHKVSLTIQLKPSVHLTWSSYPF